jgi:hypothetical protein
MKSIIPKLLAIALCCLVVLTGSQAFGQQYNSDNYLSKPHGVATIILTAGEHHKMWMTTFSLIPNWEFTAAAYLYNDDDDPKTDDGYSTSYYFKWMLYENEAKTGGVAVKGGTGIDPGYVSTYGLQDAFQTYWMNAPATVPFLDNKVSWDIMPGASVTRNFGVDEGTAAAFTYSTRLAWYPFDMETSIVGEVFGSEGEVRAIPEYKIGIRWEPNQYAVLALTYGEEFDGPKGAGFEFGMMFFTPPFLKL